MEERCAGGSGRSSLPLEPDGEGKGRESGEEETGWGNREGDVAVRSTDHRWGNPPSDTADARRRYNLVRNKLEQPDAST